MMSRQKIFSGSGRGELEAHDIFIFSRGRAPSSCLVLGLLHFCAAYLEANSVYCWGPGFFRVLG